MSDYETGLRRMRVYRPIDGAVLSSPRFQQGTAINLVDIGLMRRAAVEAGVVPTGAEVAAEIARDPRLVAAPLEDARVVAADALLNRALRDALVGTPSDEEVWAAYKRQIERTEITFVAVPNTPSSLSITRFVESNGPEIVAHYRANPKEFRLPVTRSIKMLEVRGEGARSKLEALRQRVLVGEDFGALARAHSEHETRDRGGEMGWVVRAQRPEAFKVGVGEVTPLFATKKGVAIAVVVRSLPKRKRDLNGSVRREIAASLIRRRGPTPAATELARRVRRAWLRSDEAADEVMEGQGLRREKSLPFSAEDSPAEDPPAVDPPAVVFIPGIGRSPDVLRAVRNLSTARPLSEPVYWQRRIYVLRLLHRGVATRKDFARDRAVFEPKFLAGLRRAAVPDLLRKRRAECGLRMDLAPLAARYGRASKPK
jgi:hypothetical protein